MPNENENPIEIVQRSARNATSLDLDGKLNGRLTPELLAEIAELKELTQLTLDSNQLTALPPEIAELKWRDQLKRPRELAGSPEVLRRTRSSTKPPKPAQTLGQATGRSR